MSRESRNKFINITTLLRNVSSACTTNSTNICNPNIFLRILSHKPTVKLFIYHWLLQIGLLTEYKTVPRFAVFMTRLQKSVRIPVIYRIAELRWYADINDNAYQPLTETTNMSFTDHWYSPPFQVYNLYKNCQFRMSHRSLQICQQCFCQLPQ